MGGLRIGSGSAWWGDRLEPARLNAERGDLDDPAFETMAEATISAAQVRKRRDPSFPGYYDLDDRMQRVLPDHLEAWHQDHLEPGLDQSRRGCRKGGALAPRAWSAAWN